MGDWKMVTWCLLTDIGVFIYEPGLSGKSKTIGGGKGNKWKLLMRKHDL